MTEGARVVEIKEVRRCRRPKSRTRFSAPDARSVAPGGGNAQVVNRRPNTAMSAVTRRARAPSVMCTRTFSPSTRAVRTSSLRS